MRQACFQHGIKGSNKSLACEAAKPAKGSYFKGNKRPEHSELIKAKFKENPNWMIENIDPEELHEIRSLAQKNMILRTRKSMALNTGMKHSDETKEKISEYSKNYFKTTSKEKLSQRVFKMLKTKLKKYGTIAAPRFGTTWKSAWRTVGGKRAFFRSRWENNYACYLEVLKLGKEILEWEHEPETFWFEKIRRGVRSYLPDFRITNLDGSTEYHEVKGWMDPRSKTKIKRMAKYYPDIKLILIQAPWFKLMKKNSIPGWEF